MDATKNYTIEFAENISAQMVIDALETLEVVVYYMPEKWPGIVEAAMTDAQRNSLSLQDEVAAIDRA